MILVGGAWLMEFSPTALLVSSLNSGSVHWFVFGLHIKRFLPKIVMDAVFITFVALNTDFGKLYERLSSRSFHAAALVTYGDCM